MMMATMLGGMQEGQLSVSTLFVGEDSA